MLEVSMNQIKADLFDELSADLQDLFDGAAIGAFPVRNDNGADSYRCPCCWNHIYIKGNAYGMRHLSEITHEKDCALEALRLKLENIRNEQ